MILKHAGLEALNHVVSLTNNRHIIKNGTWAISNLCRGRPAPNPELVRSAIPTLCEVLKTQNDFDILHDAAWALSYHVNDPSEISVVINTGVVSFLVKRIG